MSQYFPKPYEPFGGHINVKVDLSNYVTKTDIKNVLHIDTSSFASKTNLANLKTEVDKLDIGKLAPVSVDLSKLSDVVKNYVVKKTIYDKLVAKVNSIDTSRFVLKTKYDTDKLEIETKIPNTSDLVKKETDYNTKITEIEGKIPDVSSLATKTELTIVENKIPNINNLVKKTDYDTKITEIEKKITDHNHDKYITTPEFNTLAADIFNARLAQAILVTKTDFNNSVSSLDGKISANKTKNKSIENELKSRKTFDSSYFIGKSRFEEDGTQNHLVFQPLNKYFKVIASTDYFPSWKSKRLSAEAIKSPATSDNSLTPALSYYGIKTRVKSTGSCLKQPQVSYIHELIVNIYIVYELGASSSHNNDPTLKKCLFGAVTLTRSFPGGGFGSNVIIFRVDMSSFVHVDNSKKDILILGKGPTQDSEHTLTAEKMYAINFTVIKTIFCLIFHYNGANSYLFVNGTGIYKFKGKDSQTVATPLCLGNISKNWSVDNMKKIGFNGYVYDFSIDYSYSLFNEKE